MQKALEYMKKHHMIEAGDRVIVGVSGGADSVCLLHILLTLQKETDFILKVVHVEHGIRGEASLKDAQFVRKLCEEKKIPFQCFHYDIRKIAKTEKCSEEEAGRNMRYHAFHEAAQEWDHVKIAVAHNLNDQAETMLWNMVRGSGMRGAAGIRPVRDRIIRPLLTCTRTEIEAYLKERGISWCCDATNQENDYTRNVIRNRIMPMLEGELNQRAALHLAALGEELDQAEGYLQKETFRLYKSMAHEEEAGIWIDLSLYGQEESYMRERILRTAIERSGCGLKNITREHIRMADGLLFHQSGKSVAFPGSWIVRRDFEKLWFTKAETEKREQKEEAIALQIPGVTVYGNGRFITRILPNEKGQIPEKTYTKWLSYDKISGTLMVRSRQSGDYLVINRQGDRKKLKAYLTEEKIPAGKKDQIPLICLGQEVLWVVGHRISEHCKVEEVTKRILEITYEEE